MLRPGALLSISALFVLWSIGGAASTQAPASPTFEVASVKPATRELLLQRGLLCAFGVGGRFMALETLQGLIACAYGIPAARAGQEISGGPTVRPWSGECVCDSEQRDDALAVRESLVSESWAARAGPDRSHGQLLRGSSMDARAGPARTGRCQPHGSSACIYLHGVAGTAGAQTRIDKRHN
jgi:hypothetical protein